MTATDPLLPPLQARSTGVERLRDRMLDPTGWGPAMRWLAPLVITALAATLRLMHLGHPAQLAFDETYYVKDAWSLWTLGYEGTWGDGANQQLEAGDVSGLGEAGSFIAHPPLGKWIIGLGMVLLGPGSSAGWRLSTAILGAATVLVVYLLARRLSGSIVVASLAGLLIAVDGLSIVMSRIALLDGALTFFVLLGALLLAIDRQRTIPRIQRRDPNDPHPLWGRLALRRPWVIAAGVAFGAASAVKWSGLYALAAFGIWLVVTDALARRRAGVHFWPTDAAFRQGPFTFLLLVGPAAATYLISWTGWLVTAGGYDRGEGGGPLGALWHYHSAIMGFHTSLTTGHGYASPAWQWPLLLRPTAVWVDSSGTSCWGSDHCIAVISSVPNPLIWWAGVAAAVWLLYRFVRGLIDRTPMPWSWAVPLVGLAGTYLPWLLYPNRPIFQFYTVAMMPFLVLALAVALREVAGTRDLGLHRRRSGQRTVAVFVVATLLVSAFFYPVWTGMNVPYDFWLVHNWLPGWI